MAAEQTARPKRAIPPALYPALGVALVLAVFEIAPRIDLLPRQFFPPVGEDLTTLWDQVQTAVFWSAVWETTKGWAIGLGAAFITAVPVGIALGSSEVLGRAFRGVVEFLRPIPSVALVPMAILVFGRGLDLKVFLVVFAAFWPLLIQAMYGVRAVDPVAIETARSYRLGRASRMIRIVLPSSMPYIATGVRIASAVALILAVTAELVVGVPGLGREIFLSQSGGLVRRMYAYIIATGLLGWGLNSVLQKGERKLLRWDVANRESVT